MRSARSTVYAVIALIIAPAALCQAGDWPHWRGPHHNGSADETGLPATWSATENVAWKTPLPGPSSATPVVSGDRVFVSSTAQDGSELQLLCLGVADGNVLWAQSMGKGSRFNRNNAATPSPVTDGERVYALFGTGLLVALDMDGNEAWRRVLTDDYGPFSLGYGYSSSPLLLDGRLYLAVLRGGDRPSLVIALDAGTGDTVWAEERPTEAGGETLHAYTTPVPYTAGGVQGVVVAGADLVTCSDAETGKELWRYDYAPNKRRNWRLVPTPTVAGELVCAHMPRGGALFAVRPPAAAGEKPTEAWRLSPPGPDVASAAYYDGLLYMLDGERKAMRCVDPADGTELWKEALGGSTFWASPTAADGKLYCIDVSGRVVVLQAGREFAKLGEVALDEQGCNSTIAAAAGSLFIRTPTALYCVRQAE